MNSFLFTAITFCLAAQCALASYQSAAPAYGANSGYQQRKMAPSPQQYGQQQAYGGQEQQYGGEQLMGYEQPATGYNQRAASSASLSQYDERTPAASSYAKAAPASNYGRQQSGYGAQQASYAKPAAAKYEEPAYHAPMPFAWGYDINDGYGCAQYHKENGDEYGKRTGSYGYTDAYGVYRQVDYVADEHGFRATIKTNEPGTANESPADVELHAYEPPSNYYAGNTNSYASAAPAKSYSAGNSYGSSAAPAASYGAQQQSSYSAPKASSYQQRAAPVASYNQASSAYRQPAQRSYEPAQQYSSSVIVPVYQKQAPLKVAAAPAKRY